jgi:hypothetical protein
VQYAVTKNGTYTDSYTVPMINVTYGNSITIYYKVTGITTENTLTFQWLYGNLDYSTPFNQLVSIDTNTNTIKIKRSSYVDQYGYVYDSYWLPGTPILNGEKVETSTLTVNNNASYSNVSFDNKLYYIPLLETGEWVCIDNTSYKYQVTRDEQITELYYLVIYNEGSKQTYQFTARGNAWGQTTWGQVY